MKPEPGPTLWDQFSQIFPPKPGFVERDLPELHGKVYLITGANTGLGKELARILYAKHAKVYIAARSEAKAEAAMDHIKNAEPNSSGQLAFIKLDLADLSTIRASAQEFLRKEQRLHVLFNNAGVMKPALADAKTAQGYELQLGVNNIGTFMFTKLLTPALVATAKTEIPGVVRVVWVGSSAGEAPSAPRGGVPLDNLDYHKDLGWFPKYCISKAGNYLQGSEFARRHEADGIISVTLNPGNLDSELWRNQTYVVGKFLKWFILHAPINGAYTELFAGLSPEVTMDRSGAWIAPFGRFMRPRSDLKEATRTKAEGGSGIAKEFWEWNEEQIRPYL
ncbi:putative short-chain dehydrogenase [Rosellinia necatrix]|uniref:Putative short-chain dehydrogenase n=1 Tax=Rosellinia necatrix TaxID=77044 RepID=A0A1W2THL3_ROSNE|nr:putative short-chain dehydrogenase [Rosellinia necatrix]